MTTRKVKIDAIYDKIANKELSFGCRIFHNVDWKKWFEWKIITSEIKRNDGIYFWVIVKDENSVSWLKEEEILSIWHPIMIWDAMNFMQKKAERAKSMGEVYDYRMDLLVIHWHWTLFNQPIEDQSDECIDFIYNLI